MSWYWPPSWFKKSSKREPVPAPEDPHRGLGLAAEYFFLERKEQLQVLYHLGANWEEQSIILSSAMPCKALRELMAALPEPEKPMTAASYLDRLKAVYLDDRKHHVVACFQNIFRDSKEAEYYARRLLNWG